MSVKRYNLLLETQRGNYMSRPKKTRTICEIPRIKEFNCCNSDKDVHLTIDEYETIRLIDYMGFTHLECAKQMNVARTTVTAVYDSAKYKISDSVINHKTVRIHDGDYKLCKNSKYCCGHCGQNKCGRCNHGECELCTGIFHERGRECYVLQYN